jgi:hypothetical protein
MGQSVTILQKLFRTVGLALVSVVLCSSARGGWNTLSPGCRAVNEGALDIHVSVTSDGHNGLMGSPIVRGFAPDDVLVVSATGRAVARELNHTANLAVIYPARTETVWGYSDSTVPALQEWSGDPERVPLSAAPGFVALFSSVLVDGEGRYTLVVRCGEAYVSRLPAKARPQA